MISCTRREGPLLASARRRLPMRRVPPHPSAATALLVAGLAALLGALALAPAARPSVGSLQQGIAADQARELELSSAAGSAAKDIALITEQLDVLSGREAAVEAQLAADRERLAELADQTAIERRVSARLHAKYDVQRAALGRWLVSVYEAGRPDIVTVVFDAHGFSDLLERLDFLRRLSEAGANVTDATLAARNAATRALVRLHDLSVAQTRATDAAAAEQAALQSIGQALAGRQAALSRARAIELQQLSETRSDRARLEGELQSQLAALAAPPETSAAPSGESFAIPWPIVQCESGGQNLPPNSAGASGYYQILPSTWQGFGGTGPAAYLAPKSEQDAVAARIWDGGAGARNWVCAALVGITS